MLIPDAELVRRAQTGDLDAFGELITRHQGPIRALCMRLAVRPDMADDLAQDVFMSAHKKIDSFSNESPFGAWLRGIARNLGKMQWRTHIRRTRREADALGEVIEELTMASLDADQLDQEEQVAALQACMQDMGEKMQRLIDLRYRQGLTSAEIAEIIDGKASSVRVSLVRLHAKLKQCMLTQLGPEGCP